MKRIVFVLSSLFLANLSFATDELHHENCQVKYPNYFPFAPTGEIPHWALLSTLVGKGYKIIKDVSQGTPGTIHLGFSKELVRTRTKKISIRDGIRARAHGQTRHIDRDYSTSEFTEYSVEVGRVFLNEVFEHTSTGRPIYKALGDHKGYPTKKMKLKWLEKKSVHSSRSANGHVVTFKTWIRSERPRTADRNLMLAAAEKLPKCIVQSQ